MVDLTIFGAGIFGLSVAWSALSRGARVCVIDPKGPGGGASGGIVGALAPHVPETWNPKKAFQLESLLMAQDWWADVAQAGGRDPGYARTGRLQPLQDKAAITLAQAREEGAVRLWQGRARWSLTSDPGDFAPHSPTGLWVRDTLPARLHPRQACLALAAAIKAKGGSVVASGDARGAVVWATGWAGLVDMSAGHRRQIGTGIKGQAVLLQYMAPSAPQLFAEGVHIVPHADGTVAVGSTSERDFDDATATDDQCDALVARARALVPVLVAAPEVARWAGVRPRARSRAPLIGAWPDRPGHFIANGGFKIGFGMAPLCAERLVDLILEGREGIPLEFQPAAIW